MSLELVFTSVPRGLKPGSRGFCTVAASAGMSKLALMRLEGLSGYEYRFNLSDPQADLNPVNWSHTRLAIGSETRSVLSRVGFCGADYSGRANTIAHHVLLLPEEMPPAGPAWMLRRLGQGTLVTGWGDPPRDLPPRSLAEVVRQGQAAGGGPCLAWQKLAGDAGWAGALARGLRANRKVPAFVLFSVGTDLLPLFAESLALLPPEERWGVTFATYYSGAKAECFYTWRGVLAGSAAMSELARFPNATVIDLTRPLPAPAEDEFTQAARAGHLLVPATARPPGARPGETPVAIGKAPAKGKGASFVRSVLAGRSRAEPIYDLAGADAAGSPAGAATGFQPAMPYGGPPVTIVRNTGWMKALTITFGAAAAILLVLSVLLAGKWTAAEQDKKDLDGRVASLEKERDGLPKTVDEMTPGGSPTRPPTSEPKPEPKPEKGTSRPTVAMVNTGPADTARASLTPPTPPSGTQPAPAGRAEVAHAPTVDSRPVEHAGTKQRNGDLQRGEQKPLEQGKRPSTLQPDQFVDVQSKKEGSMEYFEVGQATCVWDMPEDQRGFVYKPVENNTIILQTRYSVASADAIVFRLDNSRKVHRLVVQERKPTTGKVSTWLDWCVLEIAESSTPQKVYRCFLGKRGSAAEKTIQVDWGGQGLKLSPKKLEPVTILEAYPWPSLLRVRFGSEVHPLSSSAQFSRKWDLKKEEPSLAGAFGCLLGVTFVDREKPVLNVEVQTEDFQAVRKRAEFQDISVCCDDIGRTKSELREKKKALDSIGSDPKKAPEKKPLEEAITSLQKQLQGKRSELGQKVDAMRNHIKELQKAYHDRTVEILDPWGVALAVVRIKVPEMNFNVEEPEPK